MSFLLCLVPTKKLQLDRKRFVAAIKYEVKENLDEVVTYRKRDYLYSKSKYISEVDGMRIKYCSVGERSGRLG